MTLAGPFYLLIDFVAKNRHIAKNAERQQNIENFARCLEILGSEIDRWFIFSLEHEILFNIFCKLESGSSTFTDKTGFS